MTDVLDIARIEKELHDINQQRSQARERLDALRPGRGRGRGPPGGRGEGRGVFSRLGDANTNGGPGSRPRDSSGRPSVFDRLYAQGSREQDAERDAAAAHQQDEGPHRRLGSRISSRISSEVVGPAGADREQQQQHDDEGRDRDRERDVHRERERPDAAAGRKRLLSAVMVNGQARQLSGSMDRLAGDAEAAAAAADEPPAKRPTIAVDDSAKRRAARMFGTLLVGTLQKFQNDEQAFKRTDTAQRRAEMEKRAQERAEAEAQRLREEAAASWREERSAKVHALHDLNLQAELKALELRYAKRIQHKQQLLGFCITTTQPPLHWQPKVPSKATKQLLQAHQESFEAWKQQLLQELEAERFELLQAAADKRQAALARLAGRQPPAAGEGAGEGEEGKGNGDAMSEDQEGVGEDEEAAGDEGGQQERDEDEEFQQEHDRQAADLAGDVQSAGEEEQEQEDEQPQQQQRLQRPRHRDVDEDEERLLSSDDEDDDI